MRLAGVASPRILDITRWEDDDDISRAINEVMKQVDAIKPYVDTIVGARDEIFDKHASIFAAAILRLCQRAALVTSATPTDTKTCLEVPAETVLSGPLEFTVPRPRDRSEPCD